MTTFRVNPHTVDVGRAAVEIIGKDGQLLAVLYATDDQHLRLVSKHLESVAIEPGDGWEPAIAEILLREA
jgi:hypothetical protein